MHIMKKQVLLIILLALPLWLKAADVSVTGLRTEQMVDPMGLDTAAPRMSWRLESSQRNVMQTAYRILVASSPELLAQDINDLSVSTSFKEDLGGASVQMVALVSEIENELDVEIMLSEASACATVKDLTDLIEKEM